jgi:hypothetical protein
VCLLSLYFFFFNTSEILEWIDFARRLLKRNAPILNSDREIDWIEGNTALCPNCGVDAVLPMKVMGLEVDTEILEDMRRYV